MQPPTQLATPPTGIPAEARTVIAWAGDHEALRRILTGCPALRRLYLIDGQAHPAPADKRIRILPPGLTPHPAWRDIWAAEPLYFAEGRVALYLPPAFQRERPEAAAAIEAFCLDYLRGFISNMAFCAVRGWHVLENISLNVPCLARARPLAQLRGMATGRSVIVVGAGPALDRNLEMLRRSRPHLLLVACDAAWLPLRRAGIEPDLVVTTDAGDLAWRFFASLDRSAPLVALLQSSSTIPHHHQGPLYLCRTNWSGYDRLEQHLGRPLDRLDSGQCVGHAAFELARLMGAARIIMAGFNLAFDGRRYHPRDMAVQVFHDHPPPTENLLAVPSVDGGTVTTDLSLYLYLKEFEHRIAAAGCEVWDATGAGALKQGARLVGADELLRACTGEQRPAWPAATGGSRPAPRPWRRETSALLSTIEQLERQLAERSADMPEELQAHAPLLQFMSMALNLRLAAAWRFAFEDYRRQQSTNPPTEASRQYLNDLRHVAGLLHEIAVLPDVRTERIMILPAAGNVAEFLPALLADLQAAGAETSAYRGASHDLPEIWRQARTHQAGTCLTWDDDALPAAWNLPGRICLNLRTRPPDSQTPFNPAENWLPGCAIIAVSRPLAEIWRNKAPADRPVFAWNPGGPLTRLEDNRQYTWQKIWTELQQEKQNCDLIKGAETAPSA